MYSTAVLQSLFKMILLVKLFMRHNITNLINNFTHILEFRMCIIFGFTGLRIKDAIKQIIFVIKKN